MFLIVDAGYRRGTRQFDTSNSKNSQSRKQDNQAPSNFIPAIATQCPLKSIIPSSIERNKKEGGWMWVEYKNLETSWKHGIVISMVFGIQNPLHAWNRFHVQALCDIDTIIISEPQLSIVIV
jgi:hypothetical protein